MKRYASYFMTVTVARGEENLTKTQTDVLLDLVGRGWRIESSCGLGSSIFYVLRKITTDITAQETIEVNKRMGSLQALTGV